MGRTGQMHLDFVGNKGDSAHKPILATLEALVAYGHMPRERGMCDADRDYELLEDVDIGQPSEMQQKHHRHATPPVPLQE